MIPFSNTPHDNPPKKLSENPTVAQTSRITDCFLGKYTEIQDFTTMVESSIDDYSYVCSYGSVYYTMIGKFSNIAARVNICPGNHPYERPTLHHFTYRGGQFGFCDGNDETFFNWRRIQKVTVGNDTWIGFGSVIMPGITIGNGAIVGSLSVVTKDVPPYTIVAGSPAQFIRRRFPTAIAEKLEASNWWDWDHETLKARFEDFKDIRVFLEKYCQ